VWLGGCAHELADFFGGISLPPGGLLATLMPRALLKAKPTLSAALTAKLKPLQYFRTFVKICCVPKALNLEQPHWQIAFEIIQSIKKWCSARSV
jgi:hypothetical protein